MSTNQLLNAPVISPDEIDWDAIVIEDNAPVDSYETEQHAGLLTDTCRTSAHRSVSS